MARSDVQLGMVLTQVGKSVVWVTKKMKLNMGNCVD